jgi:hypothetical protein
MMFQMKIMQSEMDKKVKVPNWQMPLVLIGVNLLSCSKNKKTKRMKKSRYKKMAMQLTRKKLRLRPEESDGHPLPYLIGSEYPDRI